VKDRTADAGVGDDDLLDAIRARLAEFGISLEVESPGDAIVALSRADFRALYVAEVKRPMTLGALAQQRSAAPHPRLIIGDRVGRRSAAALRAAGVQFVDALGNAFVAFGDVLVEVQGRAEPAGGSTDTSGRDARTHQPANLFSPGRSQVILALLTWPELAGGKVREIAAAAGLSVGQTHDALAQLEQAGFLISASRRLTRADELLDYWTAAYPAGLGRRLEITRFHGDPSRPLKAEGPIYLSGESAKGVDIGRPASLTVYVDELDSKLGITNRWSRNPDRAPNVFVRHKFWQSPLADEEDPGSTTRNAPWPLVYADLVSTGDARLNEVASTWRAHRARPDQ
jgi:hypothetical protein